MNNDIQEDYCSFEVAKLLKEKGYKNQTVHYYIDINSRHTNRPSMSSKEFLGRDWNSYPSEKESSRVSCPTHALAIKWIRENFGIHIYFSHGKVIDKKRVTYITNIAKYGGDCPRFPDGEMIEGIWNFFDIGKVVNEPEFCGGKGWKRTHFESYEEATEAALLYVLNNLV